MLHVSLRMECCAAGSPVSIKGRMHATIVHTGMTQQGRVAAHGAKVVKIADLERTLCSKH